MIKISIIIRTLNESRYLDELLTSIHDQKIDELGYEIIIVDSGSTDKTLEIAQNHRCQIINISRKEFSYGRSLNLGCETAKGEFLVIISGHCVPENSNWLLNLINPLINDEAQYSYGRQLGGDQSQFSEKRIFEKYFPDSNVNNQKEYFCNNANSAISYKSWSEYRFDEDLTGLEDIDLAKRLIENNKKVSYVSKAAVYHYHNENWQQIKLRFEREALALQKILPNISINFFDVVRYFTVSVLKDWTSALNKGVLFKEFLNIILYRWYQYNGVFKGSNNHRILSDLEKEKYFYPD